MVVMAEKYMKWHKSEEVKEKITLQLVWLTERLEWNGRSRRKANLLRRLAYFCISFGSVVIW
jgi:hypothetical protein